MNMSQMAGESVSAAVTPAHLVLPPTLDLAPKATSSLEAAERASAGADAPSSAEVPRAGEPAGAGEHPAQAAAGADAAHSKDPIEEFSFEEPAVKPPDTDPGVKDSAGRDYSKFDASIHDVLKGLNNARFNKHAAALNDLVQKAKRVDELEGKLKERPSFAEEHEHAYLLDPSYHQLSDEVEKLDFETQHLQQQLVRIKQGDDWQVLKGYDRKTGEPVFETVKAREDGKLDVQAEVRMSRLLTAAFQALGNKRAEQNQLITGYQASFKQKQSQAGEVLKKFFPSTTPESITDANEKALFEKAMSISDSILANRAVAKQAFGLCVVTVQRLKAQLAKQSAAQVTPAKPRPGLVADNAADVIRYDPKDPDSLFN